MKFERIDDKTVKCFLSNAELEEYEISYKDFILRSDKARELLEDVIRQAGEEIGYQPFQQAFDLSVMLLPEIGMVLTFSEKGADMDGLEHAILQKMMESFKAAQGKQEDTQGDEKEKGQNEPRKPSETPGIAVFTFEGLRDIYHFAEGLPANLRIESSLYEMNGAYYLFLEKGGASYERYSRACIRAMEFGALYAADQNRLVYIREHGTCLIAEKAVRKLRVQG